MPHTTAWQACMRLRSSLSLGEQLAEAPNNPGLDVGCLQVALLCAAGLRQQGYVALADIHKLDGEELEAHADDHVKAAAFFKRAAGIYAHVAEQAATEEGRVHS